MNPRWLVGGLAALVFIAAEFGVTVSSGPNSEIPVAVLAKPVIPVAASFISPNEGWELGRSRCVGCATLRVTSNGGRTWRRLPAPPTRLSLDTPSLRAVSDVVFADPSNGWLFGPGLWATHDGGRTWRSVKLGAVFSVEASGGAVYALTKGGRLWQAPAAGDHWTRLAKAAHGRNGAGLAVAGRRLMLLQAGYEGPGLGLPGKLWFSSDGGASWRTRAVPCRHQGGAAGVASTGGRGWLVECYSNDQSSQAQRTFHLVYASPDDGRTWRSLGTPAREGQPSALAGAGRHAFLAVESGGDDRLVGKLDGKPWRVVLDFSGFGFTGWADLHFLTARTGFVVAPSRYLGPGGRDHLYRTDDGGRSWQVIA